MPFVPNKAANAVRGSEYPIYTPPLIVEVLSASNRPAKIRAQRKAAFVAGTQEFWIVDLQARTVEVFYGEVASRKYGLAETIALMSIPGASLSVAKLFEE